MDLSDLNIADADGVSTATVTLTEQNATYYYARSRPSQFFYDDITDPSAPTPILIDVYCDLGFTACEALDIDTVDGQINEVNWWLSLGHRENATQHDGNVTLKIDLPGNVIEGAGSPVVAPTTVPIIAGAKNENVAVTSNATALPMTVEVELVRESDTPTPSAYTNEWLEYNPSNPIPLSPFYKVRFVGESGWAGYGDTGHVVDTDASTKKNRRLGW